MTPLPKKKHSRSRSAKRVAAISQSITHLVKCPNCQSEKLPHKVCPNCGFVKKGLQINLTSR